MFKIILIILSCNVLLIKSHDDKVLIDATPYDTCVISPEHTFTDGQTVTISINYTKTINHAMWRINDTVLLMDDLEIPKYETKVNSSLAGKWDFELLNLRDTSEIRTPKVQYKGHNYTQRKCSTMVKIVSAVPAISSPHIVIILIAVGAVSILIILAQTAYIVYLKSKAREFNRHENLSKKKDSVSSNDGARYCTNPRHKVMKETPIKESDRDSIIYAAPDIELTELNQPPKPPAVDTIPRPPRVDTDMGRLGPICLAATITGSRHPPQPAPYPTSKPIQHEVNLSNRPPLPLPPQETYEEMPSEDYTYELPPIKQNLPSVKSSGHPKLTRAQMDTAMKALSNKPTITPKPPIPVSDHMKIPNELENIWRKRNVGQVPIVPIPGPSSRSASPHKPIGQVPLVPTPGPSSRGGSPHRPIVQVPIVSIPGPSSRGTSPHKRRPPPVLKSKPPLPQPMDEGIYYNSRHDSSDEEWTYEPLQPIKGYMDNIYNS